MTLADLAAAVLATALLPPAVDPAELARFTLDLQEQHGKTAFTLTYHGKPIQYHGPLCYSIPGYNGHCVHPDIDWLVPHQTITLPAPGDVPAEFLRNYDLFVRFPAMAPEAFQFERARKDTDGEGAGKDRTQ